MQTYVPPSLPTTPTCRRAPVCGLGDGGADGIAKGHVAYDAIAEKCGDARKSTVDELVGDDEVGRLVLFLERANRGHGNDALDAELFECVEVGAEVQLRWEDAVAAAVAREEGDFVAGELAEDKWVGGLAEGSF